MSARIEKLVVPAKDLPPDKRWRISIDGKEKVRDVVDLINDNPKVALHGRYGKLPGSPYAQLFIEKPGGVTTCPVCVHSKHGVLIGVIGQKRPLVYPDTPDKLVATLPGGFTGSTETSATAARRELKEEAGLVGRPKKSAGSHTHMDRALIVYTTNEKWDEFFYVVVKESALKGPTKGEMHDKVWKLDQTLTPNPSPDEKIVAGLEFVSAAWLLNDDNAVDAYTQLGVFKALRSLSRIDVS